MPFQGSCHCGAVTFSVDAELPTEALSCNCSICRRKGLLLSFFPISAFTLNSGQDQLSAYTFNQHKIRHQFCRVCGAQPFAYGTAPDGAAMCAVNLRCVPDVALDTLQIHSYDGASV
ncbi:GFA family protein [Serratia marcescens]|uniref:GFA family protein n=1 Tax=Serratia marcescens TaxID=615 RepID=UPI000A38DC3E|nr:GFA family protein [Serratia marcescens]MBH2982514.1 GFA family protein [Serratia marcescens]OUI66906.1 glutathione-dependent formaldehyde-activating protein [Serratia marcescens]